MHQQRSHLSVVRPDSLPPPLLPVDVDLGDMPAVMVERKWLRDSRLRVIASADEMLAAITLQGASLDEKPSGSLPSDDAELAYLALYGRDKSGWLAVKDRALDGWVLCADGRYYHEAIARRVLDSWIKRVVARRKADAGNSAKKKVDFDPAPYDQVIARAAAALAQIDPYAPILRAHKPAAPDIAPLPSASRPTTPSATPKGSDATRREQDSSPGRSPGDSRIDPDQNDPGEVVRGEIIPPPSQVVSRGREESLVWPADWFERFKARYPKKKSWGDAEKVLHRLRKSGKLAFGTIMAGVERLVAARGDPQYVPYPASWLNSRGWEDEPDPPPGPGLPRDVHDRRSLSGSTSALFGIFATGNQGGGPS